MTPSNACRLKKIVSTAGSTVASANVIAAADRYITEIAWNGFFLLSTKHALTPRTMPTIGTMRLAITNVTKGSLAASRTIGMEPTASDTSAPAM